jgi:hypothetical protein
MGKGVGERKMEEDGRWKMEDGRWKMEDGRWKMEDGRWKMEDGSLLYCRINNRLLIFKFV